MTGVMAWTDKWMGLESRDPDGHMRLACLGVGADSLKSGDAVPVTWGKTLK